MLAMMVESAHAEEHERLPHGMKRWLEFEIAVAREIFGLVKLDTHIGFELSCQCSYLPPD